MGSTETSRSTTHCVYRLLFLCLPCEPNCFWRIFSNEVPEPTCLALIFMRAVFLSPCYRVHWWSAGPCITSTKSAVSTMMLLRWHPMTVVVVLYAT